MFGLNGYALLGILWLWKIGFDLGPNPIDFLSFFLLEIRSTWTMSLPIRKTIAIFVVLLQVNSIGCASKSIQTCRTIASEESSKSCSDAINETPEYLVPIPEIDSTGNKIQRPAIGEETFNVRWSSTYPNSQEANPVERIGRENIILNLDTDGEVESITVLSGDKNHHIKISKRGDYAISEKITEQLVLNTGIEFLPVGAIKNLREINF
ncbi:MAG: hypothetical protein KDD22_04490, partial [Bdellovibrionales bacterium]|nr:hypothetical protein [Bdellovibrionales bacterium]